MLNKVPCTHCHLEFSEDVMIKEDEHYFCCNGCQGVYHLLSDEGLDSFYEKADDSVAKKLRSDIELAYQLEQGTKKSKIEKQKAAAKEKRESTKKLKTEKEKTEKNDKDS